MKYISVVVVCLVAVGLLMMSVPVNAEGGSTKTAIAFKNLQEVDAMALESTSILNTTIHTGTPKDLVLSFTGESVLSTFVRVKSMNGAVDTDVADAALFISIYVDGKLAEPGEITLDSRRMQLDARLGDCIIKDPITGELIDVGEQFISIYELTKQAHAFNFFVSNIGAGTHQIEVKARIKLEQSKYNTLGPATDAFIGKRTLVVDEVEVKSAVN